MNQLKKWQIPVYALSGFGPNLLMIFVTAYLLDALIPTGLGVNRELWSFTGAVIVSPVLFSVLFTVAKILDGLIDVPLASLTDNLRTKWGRRKPAIAIGLVPMIISYALLWLVPSRDEHSMLNTIWVIVFVLIFFISYTMCLVSYYGSFAEVVPDERARVKLSSWKSGFDTIGYSIAYALLPLFIGFGMNIRTIVLASMPLMLTMTIPLFLIKKGNEAEIQAEPKVPFVESIKLTCGNKTFLKYLAVLACFYFGLQMFLAGQNVMASGMMQLNGWQITIMNTAAFAPVPLMLILFNFIQKRKGLRFSLQLALWAFAIAMVTFFCARYSFFPNSWVTRLIIGAIGGTIGSYAIGVFFAVPYIYPSQVAAQEIAATGKNHTAMFFAVQGLANQVVAAISTGVVYLNLKSITVGGDEYFGISLVPLVVAAACILSFVLSFLLPKSFGKVKEKTEAAK